MAGPPDEAGLRDAALAYLARYAATRTSLRRVLLRRIDRWAASVPDPDDAAAAARLAVERVIDRLVEQGAVNDASFAEARAQGLRRAGLSRRAITARLMGKGIDAGAAQASLPEDEDAELAAALVLTRKRRIGPFRAGPTPDRDALRREFGILARAGFPGPVARQALATGIEEAETRILALRQ